MSGAQAARHATATRTGDDTRHETGRHGTGRHSHHGGRTVKRIVARLAGGYVVWGVVATATFALLWPAMWVNPLGSFAKMTAEMEEYVGGHVNANFFWGQTTDDPGLLFYPIAYFFRITPATVIGLAAAAWAAARRRFPFDRPLVQRAALGFLLAGLVFVLLMSIPAKKFDRYILPAFPRL